jgi:REP element-mobilizing transposase RayT
LSSAIQPYSDGGVQEDSWRSLLNEFLDKETTSGMPGRGGKEKEMGRRPRIWYPGAVYHITNRGNGRANIFVEGDDRRLFLNKLASIMKEHGIKLYAYCLMTNHYHLLLETGNVHIAESMRMLHTFYSKQYHLKYGTCGHLFQERYRSVLVQKENYLLEVSRYIHLNPVRARLVTVPEHYPWSSFRSYVSGDFGLIDPDPILASFALDVAQAREAYRRFVYAKLADDGYSLEGLITEDDILGSAEFVRETVALYG